jgi:hypothetical protein
MVRENEMPDHQSFAVFMTAVQANPEQRREGLMRLFTLKEKEPEAFVCECCNSPAGLVDQKDGRGERCVECGF